MNAELNNLVATQRNGWPIAECSDCGNVYEFKSRTHPCPECDGMNATILDCNDAKFKRYMASHEPIEKDSVCTTDDTRTISPEEHGWPTLNRRIRYEEVSNLLGRKDLRDDQQELVRKYLGQNVELFKQVYIYPKYGKLKYFTKRVYQRTYRQILSGGNIEREEILTENPKLRQEVKVGDNWYGYHYKMMGKTLKRYGDQIAEGKSVKGVYTITDKGTYKLIEVWNDKRNVSTSFPIGYTQFDNKLSFKA